MDFAGTGILIEEPNPTGSRPSDLIGLCKQHTKPHPCMAREFYEDPTPKIPRCDTNGPGEYEVTAIQSSE